MQLPANNGAQGVRKNAASRCQILNTCPRGAIDSVKEAKPKPANRTHSAVTNFFFKAWGIYQYLPIQSNNPITFV